MKAELEVTLPASVIGKTVRDGIDRALAERGWLVWSNQKSMWWRPNRSGYTEVIEEAGVYSHEEATEIVRQATVGGLLKHTRTDPVTGFEYTSYDEVMVPSPTG